MSDRSSSTPSSPLSLRTSSERTNSLILAQLPQSFFDPLVINVLRDHFATYGTINQWVPIAGFARVIIVYNEEDDAERAKLHCDPLVLEATHDRYA
jgi:calcipressin-2